MQSLESLDMKQIGDKYIHYGFLNDLEKRTEKRNEEFSVLEVMTILHDKEDCIIETYRKVKEGGIESYFVARIQGSNYFVLSYPSEYDETLKKAPIFEIERIDTGQDKLFMKKIEPSSELVKKIARTVEEHRELKNLLIKKKEDKYIKSEFFGECEGIMNYDPEEIIEDLTRDYSHDTLITIKDSYFVIRTEGVNYFIGVSAGFYEHHADKTPVFRINEINRGKDELVMTKLENTPELIKKISDILKKDDESTASYNLSQREADPFDDLGDLEEIEKARRELEKEEELEVE